MGIWLVVVDGVDFGVDVGLGGQAREEVERQPQDEIC